MNFSFVLSRILLLRLLKVGFMCTRLHSLHKFTYWCGSNIMAVWASALPSWCNGVAPNIDGSWGFFSFFPFPEVQIICCFIFFSCRLALCVSSLSMFLVVRCLGVKSFTCDHKSLGLVRSAGTQLVFLFAHVLWHFSQAGSYPPSIAWLRDWCELNYVPSTFLYWSVNP